MNRETGDRGQGTGVGSQNPEFRIGMPHAIGEAVLPPVAAVIDRRSAFTLLEIMLVVVIIGMLLTVAVVRMQGSSDQARVTAARSDIEGSLRTALGLYELDNGRFPTTSQGLKALVEKPGTEPVPARWRKYLEKSAVPVDPWGHEYVYGCPGAHNPDGFDLVSLGKDGIESEDDIRNW